MDLSIYNNVSSLMSPIIGVDNLAINLANLSNTSTQIRQIILDARTFIARKERPTDLISKDGKNAIIMLRSTDTDKVDITKITDKFLLQNIQQSKMERAQITETFQENDPSIFFFGKRTTSYVFVGQLLNTDRDVSVPYNLYTNWVAGFERFWDEHLRGTKLSENKKIAVMLVDDDLYEGYPVSLSVNKNSMTEYTAGFSMTWIITKHISLINSVELDKFMFFSSDEKLQNMMSNIVRHQEQITVYQDFITALTSYLSPTLPEIPGEVSRNVLINVHMDPIFVDKKIVEKVIDSEDTIQSVKCTELFKKSLTFVSSTFFLNAEDAVYASTSGGPNSLSIEWTKKPKITNLEISNLDFQKFQQGLDRYQNYMNKLAEEYNKLLNELENEL